MKVRQAVLGVLLHLHRKLESEKDVKVISLVVWIGYCYSCCGCIGTYYEKDYLFISTKHLIKVLMHATLQLRRKLERDFHF